MCEPYILQAENRIKGWYDYKATSQLFITRVLIGDVVVVDSGDINQSQNCYIYIISAIF